MACASLLCLVAVTGCGGSDDGDGGGDKAAKESPASSPKSSKPVPPPAPRGPSLRSDTADRPYELRIASAELTTERLEEATLRSDEYALRLLLVAKSPDPARETIAPSENWVGVVAPGCKDSSCASNIDASTDFFPKSRVDGKGQGRGEGLSWGARLKGGTDYYVTWEAVVGAKDDIDATELCVLPEAKPCIPLGKVIKGTGVK